MGGRSATRSVWIAVVGIVLSLGLLAFTLHDVKADEVWTAIQSAKPLPLLLCIPVQGIGFFFASQRSRALLKQLHTYKRIDTFSAYLGYFVANNLFPLRIGELFRIDYLARTGSVAHSACIAAAGVERIMDLLVLCGMFFCVLFFASTSLSAGVLIPVVTTGLVLSLGGLVAMAHRPDLVRSLAAAITRPFAPPIRLRVEEQAERFATGLSGLRSFTTLASVLGLSVLFWATSLLTVTLWVWAFGLPLGVVSSAVVLLFLAMGSLIPSAPSGVGTFHFLCKTGLTQVGVDETTAAGVGLVGHALAIFPWTLIGIFVVFPMVARFWSASRSREQGKERRHEP